MTDTNWTLHQLSTENYTLNTTDIISNMDINSEYDYKLATTDYFLSVEKQVKLPTAFTLLDFNSNGRSVAFGRVSTATGTQSKAQFKMVVDIEGNLKLNEKTIFDLIYPVGSIYLSINNVNPNTLFGGTWAAWGQGRVPVGVNTSGTFNTVEKTGGAETHTLTTAQIPSHNHPFYWSAVFGVQTSDDGSIYATRQTTSSIYQATDSRIGVKNTGGGEAHNNLQPYITCYMWKRTG